MRNWLTDDFPEIRILQRDELHYANGSYDGNATVYVPKNDNLRPVKDVLTSNGNGNGKIHEDIAGEDVAHEILAHSEQRRLEDTYLIGATGSDFVLNTAYDFSDDTKNEMPKTVHNLFMVRGSNGNARYKEDPAVIFDMFEEALNKECIVGIIYRNDVIAMEPLSYGKKAWFTLLGLITPELVDLYDDIARRNAVKTDPDYYKLVLKMLKDPRFSDEDRDDFFSNKLNSQENIALRAGVRELTCENPDVAGEIFQKAIEPYRGKKVGTFCEKRFQFLGRACNEYHLKPEGIDTVMYLRTRSLEAAHTRQPVTKLSVGKDLLWDVGETYVSSTIRNMEPYKRIGRTTPLLVWMDVLEGKGSKQFGKCPGIAKVLRSVALL